MPTDERFEFNASESSFFAQLPAVLMTAAAIALILLVNADDGGQTPAPEAAKAQRAHGIPAGPMVPSAQLKSRAVAVGARAPTTARQRI